MVRDFSELSTFLYEATKDVSVNDIAEVASTSGTMANYGRRMFSRYDKAKEASKKWGLIGVGAISFGEQRLQEFQRRVNRMLIKKAFAAKPQRTT